MYYIWTARKPIIQLGGRSCIIFSLSMAFPMKLERLIQTYINDTYITVRVGKHLSDIFPIENVSK